MAGLLDYLPYRLNDEAVRSLGQLGSALSSLTPGGLPRMLFDNREAIGNIPGRIFEPNPNRPQPMDPGGGGSGWGDGPAPVSAPQTAEPMQPVPQFLSPQQVQQVRDAPTGSYQFGGQMVPYYGQPPSDAEVSAQRRAAGTGGVAGVQINPQGNTVSPAAVAPASESPQDKWMAFLDRFSPDYVSRYRQTQQQKDSARNYAAFLQSRGMNPQQAASLGAAMATNPKIAEELLKPPATMEGGLVSPVYGGAGGTGGGGDMAARYRNFIQDKAGAEAAGKKGGELVIEKEELRRVLPSFADQAKSHIRMVEELRNHPGRKGNLWWHNTLAPYAPDASIPGNTGAFDANSRLNEIKGGAFLEAFKALKGGGQITEVEGKKATDAIARMNRASSEKEFNQALDDYTAAIKRGLEKLQREAAVSPDSSGLGTGGWTIYPGNIRVKRIGD